MSVEILMFEDYIGVRGKSSGLVFCQFLTKNRKTSSIIFSLLNDTSWIDTKIDDKRIKKRYIREVRGKASERFYKLLEEYKFLEDGSN